MDKVIVVHNVCGWPNLTLLPDGTAVATVFNQPTHAEWEGDVDCWASADGGRSWSLRGTAAPHEPGTNRMNVCAGLARDGSLIVLASGWSNRSPVGIATPARLPNSQPLLPWVCRSADGGRTWTRTSTVSPPDEATYIIPFGDIVPLSDGSLGACIYSWNPQSENNSAYFYASRDDGRTWICRSLIRGSDINETTLLALPNGELLAVGRTLQDAHLDLFRSSDNGGSWRCEQAVTLWSQHPGDLLLLADGRILLSYGSRQQDLWGIGVRVSADMGRTWSPAAMLATYPKTDLGYPASVQLADGTILTTYYARQTPDCDHYHVAAMRWSLQEFGLSRD